MLVDDVSHWAELDDNNIVIRVTVGDNSHEDEGYSWLIENLGGRWIQASYNASMRKNFPGPGYAYNEELDAFIPPKPYESWVLDENKCVWIPPIDRPTDSMYSWDENELKWLSVEDGKWTQ